MKIPNITLTHIPAILVFTAIISTLIIKSYIFVLSWVTIVLILCIADYFTLTNIKKIEVQRQVPASIRNKESFISEIIITNNTKSKYLALVRDAWPPSTGCENDRKKTEILPEAITKLKYSLTPRRRGTKKAHNVTIRFYGKMHLITKQIDYDISTKITVLPEFKSRKHLPNKLKQLRYIEGATATHLRGKGSEFDCMRKYVVGDDIREIDWRASAKTQNLIVKSWHLEQDRKILILVDTSRLSAVRLGDKPRLDTHIETCLLLSALAKHAHDKVEILVVNNELVANIIPNKIQSVIADIAYAFSNIHPVFKEITWSKYIPTIKNKIKNSGLVVFITPVDQNAYNNDLLKTALHLNKGRTIIIASAYNDEFNDIDEKSDAFDKAAAATSHLIRNEIKAKFAMNKIHVLEANDEQLPSQVCDKYLQLKSKGLI